MDYDNSDFDLVTSDNNSKKYTQEVEYAQENKKDDFFDGITIENIRFSALFIKILAILNIIGGVIYSLSILGAIIGVPIILVALKFLKSSSQLEEAIVSKNTQKFKLFFDNFAKAGKYMLILIVVMIVLYILVLSLLPAAIIAIFGNNF